jgi:hypothetical protein
MRRIFQIQVLLFAALCAIGMAAAQSSGVDTDTSARLTKYLHKNRLPMVGAQISNSASGRRLMLYGFVATDFGKSDAETKSKRFLHDSTIAVINNIKVDPEVRRLKRPAADEGADSGTTPPRADWENTFDDTLHSGGVTPSNDPALNMPAAPPSRPPFAP